MLADHLLRLVEGQRAAVASRELAENSRGRREWRPESYENEVLKMVPVRLGTHSDWIAICGGYGDTITLAADGSLWFWPLEPAGAYSNDDNQPLYPLLDVSHKPQFLGNVFSAADRNGDDTLAQQGGAAAPPADQQVSPTGAK